MTPTLIITVALSLSAIFLCLSYLNLRKTQKELKRKNDLKAVEIRTQNRSRAMPEDERSKATYIIAKQVYALDRIHMSGRRTPLSWRDAIDNAIAQMGLNPMDVDYRKLIAQLPPYGTAVETIT